MNRRDVNRRRGVPGSKLVAPGQLGFTGQHALQHRLLLGRQLPWRAQAEPADAQAPTRAAALARAVDEREGHYQALTAVSQRLGAASAAYVLVQKLE